MEEEAIEYPDGFRYGFDKQFSKMSRFVITGGKRLKGELCPQGAKNEALQVICATLLTQEEGCKSGAVGSWGICFLRF